MKLKEMQTCAWETLAFFIQTMPDVPFGIDDIEVEFVPKGKAVERFKALYGQYSPDRPINDDHEYAVENNIFANAIIGREKSAVFIKINCKIEEAQLRRIVFHELMHIYCAKTEMDTEHFIDIYGSIHIYGVWFSEQAS